MKALARGTEKIFRPTDDEKAPVGEIGKQKNGVNQRVSHGDKSVHRPQREAVDDLLYQRCQI